MARPARDAPFIRRWRYKQLLRGPQQFKPRCYKRGADPIDTKLRGNVDSYVRMLCKNHGNRSRWLLYNYNYIMARTRGRKASYNINRTNTTIQKNSTSALRARKTPEGLEFAPGPMLPICDGPQLGLFRDHNARITWYERLGTNEDDSEESDGSVEESMQGYVFRATANGKEYAIKVVGYRWLRDPLTINPTYNSLYIVQILRSVLRLRFLVATAGKGLSTL